MVRFFMVLAGVLLLSCIPVSPVDGDEEDLLLLVKHANSGDLSIDRVKERHDPRMEIVTITGKVFNFAPNILPPETPVNGVHVYISEFPLSRRIPIRSDATGYWTMPVVKRKDRPLNISFVFEKTGFVTVKSNVLAITGENGYNIAVQFPSVEYYDAAIMQIEQQVGTMTGASYTVSRLVVATVGKSWASMFFNQFPHGDPGATVSVEPSITFPALGPIYFNESVIPDPTQQMTSNDGGVLFTNLPSGTFTLNAHKNGNIYSPVTFIIEEGIGLYIASPPHSLQGNNDSGPGEW